MARGDSADMLRRLKSLIPHGWFGSVAPVRDAVFGGLSDALASSWSQLSIIRAGTRRSGTTGWLLDLDAWSFFQTFLFRRATETDDAFRKRYTDEVFRPRVTRPAVDQALYDLTGRHPIITELWNPADVGGYGAPSLAYGGGNTIAPEASGYGVSTGGYGAGSAAYGILSRYIGTSSGAGAYGSLKYPYQIFIIAYRPAPPFIPYVAGYGSTPGGYRVGRLTYATLSDAQNAVSDADIYARIASVVGAGITAWVAIV